MDVFKFFAPVPKVVFSHGAIASLSSILEENRAHGDYVVFVIDHYFQSNPLNGKIPIRESDFCFYLDTTDEPKTDAIDRFIASLRYVHENLPSAVVGIGGGSTLDAAKALSIMLTNPGKTHEYQGWDLVKIKPVYKIGVPTLSGTGSETSRTTVLTGPQKKQGINSVHSLFDCVVLDPDLLATVAPQQRFYTGMDCYIHCVESLTGTFLNEFSAAFASKALELCEKVFTAGGSDAELMIASYFGGNAIVYSEVGVCHALSYGLSFAFGIHHGLANCLVFNHLEEYYPLYVQDFKKMLKINRVTLTTRPAGDVGSSTMRTMIDIALLMEKPLHNALGPQWRAIFTRDKIENLYKKILGL